MFLALTGFETCNKFTVKNSIGQKVYYAVEDTDCLTRNCCGPLRPFDMKILDNFKNEIIHLHRPLACDSCCFPCCLQVSRYSYSAIVEKNFNNASGGNFKNKKS